MKNNNNILAMTIILNLTHQIKKIFKKIKKKIEADLLKRHKKQKIVIFLLKHLLW